MYRLCRCRARHATIKSRVSRRTVQPEPGQTQSLPVCYIAAFSLIGNDKQFSTSLVSLSEPCKPSGINQTAGPSTHGCRTTKSNAEVDTTTLAEYWSYRPTSKASGCGPLP